MYTNGRFPLFLRKLLIGVLSMQEPDLIRRHRKAKQHSCLSRRALLACPGRAAPHAANYGLGWRA
eukprot:3099429-Amphidinium_carterae.1